MANEKIKIFENITEVRRIGKKWCESFTRFKVALYGSNANKVVKDIDFVAETIKMTKNRTSSTLTEQAWYQMCLVTGRSKYRALADLVMSNRETVTPAILKAYNNLLADLDAPRIIECEDEKVINLTDKVKAIKDNQGAENIMVISHVESGIAIFVAEALRTRLVPICQVENEIHGYRCIEDDLEDEIIIQRMCDFIDGSDVVVFLSNVRNRVTEMVENYIQFMDNPPIIVYPDVDDIMVYEDELEVPDKHKGFTPLHDVHELPRYFTMWCERMAEGIESGDVEVTDKGVKDNVLGFVRKLRKVVQKKGVDSFKVSHCFVPKIGDDYRGTRTEDDMTIIINFVDDDGFQFKASLSALYIDGEIHMLITTDDVKAYKKVFRKGEV